MKNLNPELTHAATQADMCEDTANQIDAMGYPSSAEPWRAKQAYWVHRYQLLMERLEPVSE